MRLLLPTCVTLSQRLLLVRRLSVTMSGSGASTSPRQLDLLGDEMKTYEAETCAAMADRSRPVVIRLDGHCFSTYTRGFDRPYDLRIHRAMVGTAGDLLAKFGAVTAYTESDEISLVFHPHHEDTPSRVPFNGRVQKLVSVFAGYASARFNFHIQRERFEDGDESSSGSDGSQTKRASQAKLRARVEDGAAHFDARVFTLPSLDRLVAYMRWRAVLDCKRNSISMLAQAHFPAGELHKVDAGTCIRMLRERKGVRWEDTPPFFRFGTFIKKEAYEKPAFNPKTQQSVVARRTRVQPRSFALRDDEAEAFLLANLWPGEGPGSGVVAEPESEGLDHVT